MACAGVRSGVLVRVDTSIQRSTQTTLTSGECAGSAQAPERQIGQMCEAGVAEAKSTQVWNCPARKMTPSSSPMARMRRSLIRSC
jgi:hypothetical protein